MEPKKTQRFVLQDKVTLSDREWNFQITGLPTWKTINAAGLMPAIEFARVDRALEIVLRLQNVDHNRITSACPGRLLQISFSGLNLRYDDGDLESNGKIATGKDRANYVSRLLKSDVVINRTVFHFLGHSNSQLKSRSCFLLAGTKDEVETLVNSLGNFSSLKSVAKKAKRIGLLFSSTQMAIELKNARCEDIPDVKADGYIFTDGCGLIAASLVRLLAQKKKLHFRNKPYVPSVFQIRCRGYKGVLTLEPSLRGKILVKFRDSMRKFTDPGDGQLGVVQYSAPYTFGYLNDEIVLLLNALGIKNETLLQKQRASLQFLFGVASGNPILAFQYLTALERFDLAERLMINGVEELSSTLKGLVRQELLKLVNKREEQRCRIFIRMSRLLFGICDPCSGLNRDLRLKAGQCFVRITQEGDGQARTILGPILVTRNPCLHPGDLQKFIAVDIPQFAHLIDCIVFPTQGRRPSADLMSGGDLDGDKFFVTWDPEIIPSTVAQAAEYPGVGELITSGPITGDNRAEYFARYSNASLGKIKNTYLKWARLKGPMSSECQELNRLFSQCVDGNSVDIPVRLQDPPPAAEPQEPFILDLLHSASTEAVESFRKATDSLSTYSLDLMEVIMSRDKMAISEFELLEMALRWCRSRRESLVDYAHHFNFNALTDEQRAWLVDSLPPTKGFPALVMNGLLHSRILQPAQLSRIRLDHPNLHWKLVYSSVDDNTGRMISTLSRCLEIFHKKLLVLRLDERMTLAIYFPNKITQASEETVDARVRVIAMPQSLEQDKDTIRIRPTKKNYRVYCDTSIFQLYELKRANTWIFMKENMSYKIDKEVVKFDHKRRGNAMGVAQKPDFSSPIISVALDKISKQVQRHVGRINRQEISQAELFTISNRDTQSMQLLDLWAQAVETDETLPLFDEEITEYSKPSLQDIEWTGKCQLLVRLICEDTFNELSLLNMEIVLSDAFDLGLRYRGPQFMSRLFSRALTLLEESSDRHNKIFRKLCDILPSAPYLVKRFLQSKVWRSEQSESLKSYLSDHTYATLRSIVLASQNMQRLAVESFGLLLRETKHLSIHDTIDLVCLISLSVRDSETALSLLLECIEPEASRTIVDRPLAVRLLLKDLIGVAIDHIDECSNTQIRFSDLLQLGHAPDADNCQLLVADVRLDSKLNGALRGGDHISLTAANSAANSPNTPPDSIDALIEKVEGGRLTIRSTHDVPIYFQQCKWKVVQSASFVTSRVMFDAIRSFFVHHDECCLLYPALVGFTPQTGGELSGVDPGIEPSLEADETLNQSQKRAMTASATHNLVFIWGPPGTGKTHTIISILKFLLKQLSSKRFLITAPTHNAVDNLLEKYLHQCKTLGLSEEAIRVTTDMAKVSPSVREHTVVSVTGSETRRNFSQYKLAQKKVKNSRLVFTTAAGAGLGLLRDESFEVVIVDEASQLSEPMTLVPLTKGCERAILVGDHVQLRPTVQQNAALVQYDVSLFERCYTNTPEDQGGFEPHRDGVSRVMLDVQYRMHEDICDFSSKEFYGGNLTSAVAPSRRVLSRSAFPWPSNGSRKVFVECASPEDLGRRSKSNPGQADVCKRICELLQMDPSPEEDKKLNRGVNKEKTLKPGPTINSIAILTPYTAQRQTLEKALPTQVVSSVDAFQGREADIIIFVTVRCNTSRDIGFLEDMRRLNVAMTRARCGVIIIGNRDTLVGRKHLTMSNDTIEEDKDVQSLEKETWNRLLNQCVLVNIR